MTTPSEILREGAARFGDKIALESDTRSLSYTELDDLSDRMASWLQRRGVEPGMPVSIYSENRWEWIVAYHGILKAAAVVNPLNVMLTPEEVSYATTDCKSVAVIGSSSKLDALDRSEMPTVELVVGFESTEVGDAEFGETIDEAASGLNEVGATGDELCTIGYTSGTTGHPKGAMQSAKSVFLNCALTATMHVRTPDDVVVTSLPAPHVYGNVVINGTFMAGGKVRLMERFDPGAALEEIARCEATMFEGVPAMYSMMLSHESLNRFDLTTLTRSTVGGQTIAKSTMEAWEQKSGAPLIELWGMTELAGLGTTHSPYAPNVHGSVGVSLPGLEVRVASMEDSTQTAPSDEPGELMVRGPLVMQGYFGNEEATAEVITDDGWLHTGDVAYRSEDGYYFIVDRVKDVILTGGYNVYPAEIERVLVSHGAVDLVGVGPVEDEVRGEIACAYVVLRPGQKATEEELIEHCRPHLAAYKLPRVVRFVSELPMTSSGKIMRRKLADIGV